MLEVVQVDVLVCLKGGGRGQGVGPEMRIKAVAISLSALLG